MMSGRLQSALGVVSDLCTEPLVVIPVDTEEFNTGEQAASSNN
jgi:hypothetical protein